MNQPLNFAEQIGKQILTRHSALIDKKFLDGLTNEEADELILINRYLDAAEEAYHAPIMKTLAAIQRAENTNYPPQPPNHRPLNRPQNKTHRPG